MLRLCRFARDGLAACSPFAPGGVCNSAFFASLVTFSSSSAIRAVAALAVRLASRFFARSVALARSSVSTCRRSSSLLSFRAGAAATVARLGATVGFVTFAGVFAATGAGRPGLRPRTAGFVVLVILATRAMVLNSCDPSCRQMPIGQLSASCLYRPMSARKGLLHLFRWAKAKFLGRCNLDRLARRRITTLTGRAVLDLELAKAREVDLFTLLRCVDDTRE